MAMTVESAKQAVAEKHGYGSWRKFLKKWLFAQEENGDERHEMEAEVFAMVDAEIGRLTAELEKHRWIPVGKRLPEIKTPIEFVWGGSVFVGVYVGEKKWRKKGALADSFDVTHWRYLPELP